MLTRGDVGVRNWTATKNRRGAHEYTGTGSKRSGGNTGRELGASAGSLAADASEWTASGVPGRAGGDTDADTGDAGHSELFDDGECEHRRVVRDQPSDGRDYCCIACGDGGL